MPLASDLLVVGPSVVAYSLAHALGGNYPGVSWTGSGLKALEMATPGCTALIHPGLPDLAALPLIRELRRQDPGCRPVFMPLWPELRAARLAMAFGAAAVSSNTCGFEALEHTLDALDRGETLALGEPATPPCPRDAYLIRPTDQGLALLAVLAATEVLKQICADLDVTPQALHSRLDVLRDKLGASRNADLVSRARELGLLPWGARTPCVPGPPVRI